MRANEIPDSFLGMHSLRRVDLDPPQIDPDEVEEELTPLSRAQPQVRFFFDEAPETPAGGRAMWHYGIGSTLADILLGADDDDDYLLGL